MRALKTTCVDRHGKRCQAGMRGGAYDGVGLAEARRKGFADVMDGAVFRPGRGNNWIEVLRKTGVTMHAVPRTCKEHTLGFGGAAFGLQASLTTLS